MSFAHCNHGMVECLLLCLATAVGLTFIPTPTAMPFFFPFLPLLLLPLSYKQAHEFSTCMQVR